MACRSASKLPQRKSLTLYHSFPNFPNFLYAYIIEVDGVRHIHKRIYRLALWASIYRDTGSGTGFFVVWLECFLGIASLPNPCFAVLPDSGGLQKLDRF